MSSLSSHYKFFFLPNEDGTFEASISAGLNVLYREIFENALVKVENSEFGSERDEIVAGIKVIVFGCFWLEAEANFLLPLVLTEEIESSQLSGALWQNLKRSSIYQKLDIISSVADEALKLDSESIRSEIQPVFDLRNRLAHFKETRKLVSDSLSPEDVATIFQEITHSNPATPPPVGKLKVEEVESHAAKIDKMGDWLLDVLNSYSDENVGEEP